MNRLRSCRIEMSATTSPSTTSTSASLPACERAEFVAASQDFGPGFCGTFEHVERLQPDVVDEEG